MITKNSLIIIFVNILILIFCSCDITSSADLINKELNNSRLTSILSSNDSDFDVEFINPLKPTITIKPPTNKRPKDVVEDGVMLHEGTLINKINETNDFDVEYENLPGEIVLFPPIDTSIDTIQGTSTTTSTTTTTTISPSTTTTIKAINDNEIFINNDYNSVSNQVASSAAEDVDKKNNINSHQSTSIYVAIIGIIPAAIGSLILWFHKKCCLFCCNSSSFARRKKKNTNQDVEQLTRNNKTITIEIPNNSGKTNEVIQLKTIKVTGVSSEEIIAQIEEENFNKINENERRLNLKRKSKSYSIEYPRTHLELINKIDEGNFGQVWKGLIHSVNNDANQTPTQKISKERCDNNNTKLTTKLSKDGKIVAVKTNKLNANELDQIELLNELDIMTKLNGHHPNVVNLIACCTDTVPYYLILEYVERGKLHSILKKMRTKSSKSYSANHQRPSSSSSASATSSFSSSLESLKQVSGKVDETGNNKKKIKMKKQKRDAQEKDAKDENHKSLNNYEGNNFNEENERKLLNFIHEISSGMQFIAKHGIIHRDLATRNVLVSKDWTCKIADFGLARCVNEPDVDAYESKTKGALPVRWMSPEALFERIFSIKSDVWSFGVVIWEIVTLGLTPYPSMSPSDVAVMVKGGQVMEKPDHCSDAVYDLMKNCWKLNPNERPSFDDLSQSVKYLIDDSNGYIFNVNSNDEHFYYNYDIYGDNNCKYLSENERV